MSDDQEEFERARVRTILRARLFGAELVYPQLGRFEVRGRVGQGATGVVYRAYDPKLAREIAVKLLHGPRSARARRRLEAEGRSLARLSHPNVVAIHDIGERDGDVFLAMELVVGCDLRAWLAGAPRTEAEIVDVLLRAGAGLAAAHREGLVHRDFKPENVLVGDGVVRVADFGLAAVAEDDDEGGDAPPRVTPGTTPVGTPGYMAPEQVRGDAIDARADQYAFALVLLEALTSEHPASGVSSAAATARLTRWLRPIVERALAPDPAARFASLDAMLAAIERGRGRSRRVLVAAVAAAALVALGAMTVRALVPERSPCAGSERRLGDVWNGGLAAETVAAFRATDLPFAARAAEHVVERLDAYVQRWERSHRQVCEATWVRHEQSEALLDVRMACLARARGSLAATVGLVAAPDRDLVIHAATLVENLAPVDVCLSLSAPSHIDRIEPAAATEIEQAIAGARALSAAGRHTAAVPEAERAARIAHDAGGERLDAEARVALGRAYIGTTDFEAAVAALFDAIALATSVDDVAVAADAAVALVESYAVGLARYAEARHWMQLADAYLERAGRPVALRAELATSRGEYHRLRAETNEAVRALEEAMTLAEEAYGAESAARATAMTRLGWAMHDDRGCELIEQARAIRERVLGADHPDLIESHSRLGNCAQRHGDAALADEHFDRALALARAVHGPDHRDVGRVYIDVAWLRLAEDRTEDADAALEAARRVYHHVGNAQYEATALMFLAEVRLRQARYDDALALLDQEEALGDGDWNNVGARARMALLRGEIALATRDFGAARTAFETTESLSREIDDGPMTAFAVDRLGSLAFAMGEPARAAQLHAEAVALFVPVAAYEGDAALARFHLARALWASDPAERERARALATEARQPLAEPTEVASHPRAVAAIDAWLADPASALALYAPPLR